MGCGILWLRGSQTTLLSHYIILVTILLSSSLVVAQDHAPGDTSSTQDDVHATRSAGIAAARNGDWDRAIDLFAIAYDAMPDPLTLYNLSAAQMQAGRWVEAEHGFQTFLETTSPSEHQAFRSEARRSLDSLVSRIPRLTLVMTHIDRVTLNGVEVPREHWDTPRGVNPGRHELLFFQRDQQRERRTFRLREGQELQIVVALSPPEPIVVPTPAEIATGESLAPSEPVRDEELSPPLHRRPVFWVVVASVVAAGVGVSVAMLARPQPFDGDLNLTIR